MSPTVLIADDHPIVRAGIRRLLERRDDLEIVKEVGDGQEALEGILKSQPDLAILDVEMPRLSGIEVSRKVRESGSATATVVLSVHTSGTAVRGALEAGAAGYVVKTADIGELVQALDTVRSGGRYLSPGILRLVVDEIAEPPGDKVDRLTNREREVLTLIAEGYSSPEIALQLGVAAKTISTHRSNLMEKLKIHKVSGLVRYAIREGLLKP